MQIDFGGGSEISFERKGKAGLVKLTRTEALNALTHKMILALDRALQSWEDDPEVACVILEGEGGPSVPAAMWSLPTSPVRPEHQLTNSSATNIGSMRALAVFQNLISP